MQKIMLALENMPFIQKLRSHYEQLSARDQNIFIGLAALVVVVCFYVFLWSSLADWSAMQRRDYGEQVEVMSWMRQHIAEAQAVENKKNAGVGQRELSSVISSQAKQAGVVLSRIQPDKRGVAVWLEDAAYQKVLSWLVLLESKYEIVVQQIKLERLKEEGRVRAYIHLGSN